MTDDEHLAEFREHWGRCAKYIEPALSGAYSLGDVLNEITEGRARFWPMARSAVVTRIHDYPRSRTLRIWLAGGDMDELVGFLDAADNYARSEKCERIELEGRKGWAKVLTGYEVTNVVLTREVPK